MFKKIFKTVFVITLSIGGIYFILVILSKGSLTLPPEYESSSSMYPLKTRIIRFANKNNRLPINLQDLLPLEGFINTTNDVWGNPFTMTIEGSTVTLISYGQDKQPGGIKNNKDVIGIFAIKTDDGAWVEENDNNWIKKPLREYEE